MCKQSPKPDSQKSEILTVKAQNFQAQILNGTHLIAYRAKTLNLNALNLKAIDLKSANSGS